jgi:signal transduction histidine kinase
VLTVAPVDVAELVRTAAAEVASDEHPVRVEVADGLPAVPLDADRFLQVLTNVIGNACKFSPAGSVVEVAVRLAEGGTTGGEGGSVGGEIPSARRVVVEVDDRGTGIPVSSRDAVFELFVQAEPASTRSAGGLGVGLYVVARLCEAMGIDVEVVPREHGGTRFRLSLPPAR